MVNAIPTTPELVHYFKGMQGNDQLSRLCLSSLFSSYEFFACNNLLLL